MFFIRIIGVEPFKQFNKGKEYQSKNKDTKRLLGSALGKRLNELLPSIEKRRITIGKGRKNAYLFTPLDVARDEFVQVNRLTSIRWAEDEELRLQQVS